MTTQQPPSFRPHDWSADIFEKDRALLLRCESEIALFIKQRVDEGTDPIEIVIEVKNKYGLQIVTAKALLENHSHHRSALYELGEMSELR